MATCPSNLSFRILFVYSSLSNSIQIQKKSSKSAYTLHFSEKWKIKNVARTLG